MMELELSNNGSRFNMNCTNFTVEEFEFINRFRSITAIACMVILMAILLFLICSKAYSTVFQRLYVYLIIANILAEIVTSLTIEHQWNYKGQKTVCVWLGFFALWTYYLVFVFTYEIVGYILYLVISKIRMSPPPPKCFRIFMEMAYILTPVLISTTFSIQAYKTKSYGIAGPWCFVRSLNDNCEPIGFVIQMIFFSINVTVGIASIAVSVIFSVVYFKLAKSYKEARHLLKQSLYVMIFQCIHTFVGIFHFSVRLYTLLSQHHQLYDLWLTHAFTIPTGTLIFPLGILVSFYPVRKILHMVYERIIVIVCCRYRNRIVSNVHIVQSSTKQVTIPQSDRITQPSSTYFNIPHPESNITCEESPLINEDHHGDTRLCWWLNCTRCNY